MSWQKIESARKDAGYILGYSPQLGGIVDVWRWESQDFHKKPKPYWCRPFFPVEWDRGQQPTHWQPLPAPPEEGR